MASSTRFRLRNRDIEPYSQPSPSKDYPQTKKRNMVTAAPWQVEILKTMFEKTQYPTEDEKKLAVEQSGLHRNPKKRRASKTKKGSSSNISVPSTIAESDPSPPASPVGNNFPPSSSSSASVLSQPSQSLPSFMFPTLPDLYQPHFLPNGVFSSATESFYGAPWSTKPPHMSSHSLLESTAVSESQKIPFRQFTEKGDVDPMMEEHRLPTSHPSSLSEVQAVHDIASLLFSPVHKWPTTIHNAAPTSTLRTSHTFSAFSGEQFRVSRSSNTQAAIPKESALLNPPPISMAFSSWASSPNVRPAGFPVSFPARLSDVLNANKRLRTAYLAELGVCAGQSVISPHQGLERSAHAPPAVGEANTAPVSRSDAHEAEESDDDAHEAITPQDEISIHFPSPKLDFEDPQTESLSG
ncbi:hypothetical protein JAAARDRAFT_44906 [Jaapia argillacea MUCL 33604]|uniref:Homeobox domain-containing protein n=1 Tax=Jaapia argillacea MUCL 33604 TaxID=933084 RepID=A0A067Q6D7_9AGAM|nr:hypothetical protein JAAARDRAFT_44906 [Jaapia argillacea MUCL 33604]